MGAWIETYTYRTRTYFCKVAPLVGAWIETSQFIGGNDKVLVAPLVGAWIETKGPNKMLGGFGRRTPRGCVD